jgi:Cu(I)/Ag(I) efflux system membrane fusion protein
MKLHSFRFAALTTALALLVLSSGVFNPMIALAQSDPRWEAVRSEVPVGKGVRLEVRLVGPDAKPVTGNISVSSSRLDMGPDGMQTMTAPLRPVSSSTQGVIAFETDIVMAGRWALTVTANIAGQAKPASGTVIFTASEKRSEASPATPAGDRRILYYRNPMGLPDISPVPKKDPMGMDYIAVYDDEMTGPAGTVRIAPEKVQRAGVRTDVVTRRDLVRTVRAVGAVMPDESRLAVLTTKFEGFVEELFVPITGAEVRAGQPLMRVWIESREILQKQSDLLIGLRGAGQRPGETERAERNLRLFGIPDQVIQDIRRTGDPVRSIVITASTSGTVMEKPALKGMRFSAGDTLFKLADLSTVWVIAQIAERDLHAIQVGQRARITFRATPEDEFGGRVTFVYPELNPATRTASVRIEVPNRDRRIKLGQYADVTFDAALSDQPVVAIPESAIIDSGSRRVAFVVRGDGVFEPRDLVLGRRGTGFVEVRGGISDGERIVVTGNFLIDAESNLRAALTAFTAPATAQ